MKPITASLLAFGLFLFLLATGFALWALAIASVVAVVGFIAWLEIAMRIEKRRELSGH